MEVFPVPATTTITITTTSLPCLVIVSSLVLSTLSLSHSTTVDNSVWREKLKAAPAIQYSSLSGPSFDNTTATSISVVAGSTALLPCAVNNLHNYTVSWVRGRDIRLLTTRTFTYTVDKRFVSVNPGGRGQWALKIHHVRKGDGGSYLCQVSTTPPITQTVNLTVHEAVARVEPSREVYVQSGSRLELVCQVSGCPAPTLLAWRRDGREVQDTQYLGAGHAVQSNNSVMDRNGTGPPVFRLALTRPHATHAHSGVYTCVSTCALPINVTVHVLKVKGEELAAMQHRNSCGHLLLPSCLVCCSLVASATLQLLARVWTEELIPLLHQHFSHIPGSPKQRVIPRESWQRERYP